MSEYFAVLMLAALPAAGNFAGGILAEFVPVGDRLLSHALHAATGVVLAVIGIELMGEVLSADRPWIPILALLAGGGAAVGMEATVEHVRSRFGAPGADAGPWMIYIGVAVDLFSDGIMIGSGSTLAISLGLLLALGQVPADVPEGFATIASFKRAGVSRWRRILLGASFALPIFCGATIGYWAVRGAADIYKFSLLAFTAGILLTVAVEEILEHAHETEDTAVDSILLVGGFALFALISVYIG